MTTIYRTRTFSRWMKRSGLTDEALSRAVAEMSGGLIDADLGGYLLKKRVAPVSRGKRAGSRTIVATKFAGRWFFVFGFNKNERDNLSVQELRALQELAKTLLQLSSDELERALAGGELAEVCDDFKME